MRLLRHPSCPATPHCATYYRTRSPRKKLKTRRLAILDVQGLPLVRDWYVVRLAAKRLAPVAQAFRTFLLSEAGKLIPEK